MERALKIEWTTRAVRDLRNLASQERRRVVEKVEQYAADQVSLRYQVTRLVGSAYYRMRVGNYRVLFTIEEDGTVAVMVIERVRHRREAYD